MKKIYSFTNPGLTQNDKPQLFYVVASTIHEAIDYMRVEMPHVSFSVVSEGPECMISE